jgi:tRNA threonylcarbamoyladenosine biosynthesis protein TsaE
MKNCYEEIYVIDNIQTIADNLISFFQPYKIFAFYGTLGAGKTTFIAALCQSLGSRNTVTSPTFSLVNEYDSEKGSIYHFDLYRLNTMEEALDIGLEEYIYSKHYCFIEWPQKITEILPKREVVHCEISYLSLIERKIKAWVL